MFVHPLWRMNLPTPATRPSCFFRPFNVTFDPVSKVVSTMPDCFTTLQQSSPIQNNSTNLSIVFSIYNKMLIIKWSSVVCGTAWGWTMQCSFSIATIKYWKYNIRFWTELTTSLLQCSQSHLQSPNNYLISFQSQEWRFCSANHVLITQPRTYYVRV